VTRGQLPQRAGSLGLNGGRAAAAVPLVPQPARTNSRHCHCVVELLPSYRQACQSSLSGHVTKRQTNSRADHTRRCRRVSSGLFISRRTDPPGCQSPGPHTTCRVVCHRRTDRQMDRRSASFNQCSLTSSWGGI